jgi:hypothetical protein
MEHCQPLDGEASVIPSVGNPGDYTYSWYAGKNVLVNPSFPVTGNVLTGLAAGFYTVKAVNSNTTCQAPAVTIEVLDNTKSITITVVPDPAAYPTECESEDGTIKATISVAGGNTFGLDVKWFQSDPATTPPVKQDILKQSSMLFGSPVTDMLDQIPSGFYTIVVVNKDDNCESEKEYFLPTIRTDSLNVVPTDKTVCGLPGNGEIEALLVIKPKPVGATPTSKNDYIMELWKDGGATPVATIAGATNANNTFNFTALDTGKYYVYARRADPNRGDICETFSDYYEIKDMIVDPGLELDSVINTNCFDGLNNANGQVIATTSGPAVQSIHFFEGINITDIVNPGPIQTGVSNTLNNLKGGYYTAVFTGTNRCAILSSIFVPADTSFIDANITTLPLTECAPYPPGDIDGSVTIVSLTEEKASGSTTTNSVAGYTVTWFDETGVTTIADPMAPAEVLENRMDGEYYVHLKNNITKCQSPQIVAVVDDLREFPVIELVDFLTPTQCLKVDLPKPNHDPVTQQRVGYLDINVTGTGPLTTTWTSSEIPPAVIMGDDVQGITTAGTFSVTVRNTNTTCSTTEQYVIPIERVPVVISASAVPLLSCINPDGQLSAIVTSADSLKTGRYTDYMYLWYFGQTDTTAIAHKQRVINDAIDTVYTLVVRDRVDASCEAQAFIEVEDGRIFPVVTAGMLKPLSVCDTTKAPADGMGYAEVDGNTIDYNFEWTGEPPQVNDIFDKDPIAEGLRTGIIYTVRASNKVTGCPGTAEVSVEFVPPPISPPNIVLLSDVTKCDVLDDYPQGPNTTDPDGALSVSVGGNVTDYIFDWYNPGDLINIAYTGIQYDTLPPGEYTVIATDRRTFCTATAKETVGFKPAYPEFVIETLPTVCELTTGSIYLTVTNNIEISDIVWEWTGDADGDGTAENFPIPNYETGPVVQEAQSGVYNVVVSTPQGCWQNGSALIKTEINPFNGISRNGDNMNSYFHINCIENFPFNIVKIYNRAGTLVFEGKNYDNNTVLFNGESNKGISIMGTNLPDGTYFYVIDKHDGSKPLAGYLEIVK